MVDESKSYTAGQLSCSAFCIEDRINEMQIEILHKLQLKINDYMNQLHLNQKAIERQTIVPKTRFFWNN
ncbi:hypothetical protein D3C74_467160 [compost metagenome]